MNYDESKNVHIILIPDIPSLIYDCKTETFSDFTRHEYLRYLKGKYSNTNRFFSRYVNRYKKLLEEQYNGVDFDGNRYFPTEVYAPMKQFFDSFTSDEFESAKPFTYKEVLSLESQAFQKAVFDTIDISEMMNELGAKRVAVDGKESINKIFGLDGSFVRTEEISNVYELYEIDGEKLDIPNEKFYAIKCWCTSTSNEHYIWLGDNHGNKPLDAIASTFSIHSNLKPYIKEIKRQGDILVVELTENVKPEGEMVQLTADEYFGFLTSQS